MPLPSLASLLTANRPALPVISGASKRPDWCRQCPQDKISYGFVPDEYPENPIVAFLLEAAGRDEALESRPLAGKSGQLWEQKLITALGYKRSDVLIANTLRCRPPKNEYPTGKARVQAEKLCRHYDVYSRRPGRELEERGLIAFKPNLFLITFHPAAVLRTPVLLRLVQADVEKAFRFATEKGYRPLVLMGDKAMHLVAPWTKGKGGVKFWRSHWWEGNYGIN